jgi:hypothetical protein
MSEPPLSHLHFDSPARYEIRVSGHIAPRWADYLQGMSIDYAVHQGRPTISVLRGELPDQAALAGVLNMLYEMHMPVLSVQCLSTGQSQ